MCGPFEYNKMLLVYMGCNAQVHKKTDKQCTWAYHSVDGWYISTSPAHCRTHACHTKAIKSERLSDTMQSKHKHITNPTVTHTKLVMKSLLECVVAI